MAVDVRGPFLSYVLHYPVEGLTVDQNVTLIFTAINNVKEIFTTKYYYYYYYLFFK
jgi:hypothetical protein